MAHNATAPSDPKRHPPCPKPQSRPIKHTNPPHTHLHTLPLCPTLTESKQRQQDENRNDNPDKPEQTVQIPEIFTKPGNQLRKYSPYSRHTGWNAT